MLICFADFWQNLANVARICWILLNFDKVSRIFVELIRVRRINSTGMEREHCTVLAKAAKTPWRIWQLKEQSRKLWPFFQIGPNALRCEVAFSAPASVETTSESFARMNFSTDFSSFFLKHHPGTIGCHSANQSCKIYKGQFLSRGARNLLNPCKW